MFSKHLSPLSAVLPLFIALFLFGCAKSRFQKTEGLIWNTAYHVTFDGDPSLADSIIVVLNDVGKSLNVFDTTSLVSRVNRLDTTLVDNHFKKVYKGSMKAYTESHGMFDPTLSPLIAAWGFGKGHEPTADTLRIPLIMEYVGMDKTHLHGDTLIKDNPNINFNFSAIAKGYACDAVAAMLRRNEVTNYLVEIGGEIAMGGVSPSMDQWRVSIDRPIETDSSIVHDACAVIQITDAGMATSGNYRNFHKQNGQTMGHTISSKTGRPVATDVISATVIAPSAMEADAIATACMAAGSEEAKRLISTLKYEALLILADSTTWSTPGLSKQLDK
ncbi:MAG: FAD:protein FMN transferase [Muribaculaceae bacterium]|nr:FAD:protein FMN transferase [Muribaculaceae bacterium]